MVKKINYINNIRGFLSFNAEEIEFSKKNIIYAPNGIGKTTLSRIFNRISKHESLDDLLSQEADVLEDLDFKFKINDQDISKSNYSQFNNAVLVFNSDYIDNVIKEDDFSANDVSGNVVIPIGEESNEIVNITNELRRGEKERQSIYGNLVRKFEEFKTTKIKDKQYGEIDRSIWIEFSIDNLINKESFKVIEPQHLSQFENCEIQFSGLSELTDENKINISNMRKIIYDSIDFDKIVDILKTPKTFNSYDEDTKKSIEFLTKNWVEIYLLETGVKKSREKDKCLLCKRPIDKSVDQLFAQYEEYFSNEESKYKQKLTKIKSNIESMVEEVENKNNNLEIEVNKLAEFLGIKKTWIEINTDVLVSKLQELSSAIEKKTVDSSKVIIVFENNSEAIDEYSSQNGAREYGFKSTLVGFNKVVDKNRNLINEINKKIDTTSFRKTQLRQLIGKKFLHYLYEKNSLLINSMTELSKKIYELKLELVVEKSKLPTKDVSENVKKLCNIFLKKYLYLDKYEVKISNDLIELHLNGSNISQNSQSISEGEKTMIALCYFFASSIKFLNNADDFSRGIFVIDDPVNSTGYNYFFGVCNLIKHFDKTILKKIWNVDGRDESIEGQTTLQKIILTHNTQFFNVIRENIFREKAQYLLLSPNTLEVIGNRQLKSEFDNALINIKKAVLNEEDISIGNDLRRFFETIRHFYGIKEFNYEALREIFTEFEEHKHAIFYTVVNYYSHGNPESHTDPLPINMKPFIDEFSSLILESPFKDKWENIEI